MKKIPCWRLPVAFGFLFFFLFTEAPLPAQGPPGRENPQTQNRSAVLAGRRIFATMCQSCHGLRGGGGRAPALRSRNFKRGSSDGQLFDTIQNGIPATEMPASGLKSEEIWQVITYIRQLTGSYEEHVPGNPIEGRKILSGKGECLKCHEVSGQGSRLGPDLSTIGSWSAAELRKAILQPGAREGYRSDLVTVKTRDGRVLRGLRRNEDTFSLQMMLENEDLMVFTKNELLEVNHESKSLMPDFAKRLSATELQNLIAYLKTLKARDLSAAVAGTMAGGLPYERIRNSEREPHNWLTYWGDYQGTHYSTLKQINAGNVGLLQAQWMHQPGSGLLESTPLVVDGIMYTTGNAGRVFALDAATGLQIWEYKHKPASPKHNLTGQVNRGVAMLEGRLFATTGDAYVIALDAKTGRLLWQTQMANAGLGYYATMAPLAIRDRIIAGISGGEEGIRGFIDAYEPKGGKRLWRFYTVPGPGEFGRETWEGESWKTGGGPTWMTGTYDPELDVIYWGIGNPSPDLNGDARRGDNLFTCSVLALDAATGRRRWHFQFTPHDSRDWDSNETPVLVDRVFHGKPRKLLLHADRNAFFYVLDRITGEFLQGTPFARQTWADGLDKNGRPILRPGAEPTVEGNLIYPNLAGATNWQAPSYDPATGWFYLTFREAGDVYVKQLQKYEAGKSYWAGRTYAGGDLEYGGIKALDPETGEIKWQYRFHTGGYGAGCLATAGGIVFAASSEGNFMAFDSRTGKLLWRFQTGAEIHASPISYEVGGRQYVALAAGQNLLSFALPASEPVKKY
ncbi:MAG TPA: PQQ-dependent dehydrogenase, methanol/ethanol family [Acidobacteriota bacterium]|jgi:alcohol dehydrogenase (cytochrome c)|nr:PQQ-dependent dehydrogenase, methanol/ethanol family [Acidobacteriota bacterium]